MTWFQNQFDAKAAADLRAVVLFDLSGEGGGSLALRIDGGKVEAERGGVSEPDVHFRASAVDFFNVLDGSENVDVLHMKGQLEVEGDLGVAMKLRTLFPTR